MTRTWKAGEPPRERRTKLPWPGVRRHELLELVDRHATWQRLCARRFLPDAARVLESLGARVEWTQGLPDTVVLGDWEAPLARRPNAQQALAELGRSTLAARAQRSRCSSLLAGNSSLFTRRSSRSSLPACATSLSVIPTISSWTGLHDPAPLAVFEHLTSVRLR